MLVEKIQGVIIESYQRPYPSNIHRDIMRKPARVITGNKTAKVEITKYTGREY
jgi:hypothetical protein